MDAEYVKIAFPLAQDNDGWPPVVCETLWAVQLGEGLFRLDNIPFYARGVSDGDVVSASLLEERLVFQEVVHASLSSTFRIILSNPDEMPDTRNKFRALGCPSELSNIPSLAAIHIPAEASIKPVADLLQQGETAGIWEYEEGVLRHVNSGFTYLAN